MKTFYFRSIIVFSMMLVLNKNSFSQLPTFSKRFSNACSGNYDFSEAESSADGNLYYVYPTCSNWGDFGLVKLNLSGDSLWSKQYYLPASLAPLVCQSIKTTHDNGLIIGGDISSYVGVLMRLDSLGNIMWSHQQSFSPQSNFYFTSVSQMYDATFIASGRLIDSTGVNYHTITKVDQYGTFIWNKIFRFSNQIGYSAITKISDTKDSNVIAVGYYNNYSNTDTAKAFIISFDALGNLLWNKVYSNSLNSIAFEDFFNSFDKSFYLLQLEYGGILWQPSSAIVKVDSIGNILWGKGYSNIHATALTLSPDSEIYITGANENTGSLQSPLLIKTDLNGDPLLSLEYGITSGGNFGLSILLTPDSGLIISSNKGNLFKTNLNGNTGCTVPVNLVYDTNVVSLVSSTLQTYNFPVNYNSITIAIAHQPFQIINASNCAFLGIDEISLKENLSVSPNPITTSCIISSPSFTNSTLTLYDITGRALLQQPINSTAELNLSVFTPGIYIIEVKDKQGHSAKAKVVKE